MMLMGQNQTGPQAGVMSRRDGLTGLDTPFGRGLKFEMDTARSTKMP